MNSFKKARLKLTAWYVLFVMILSITFSFAAYRFLTMEVDQSLRSQAVRLYTQQGRIIAPDDFADIYNEARDRILYRLIMINGGILILSFGLSYFLAGKTLHPLELAVEEQKRFIADASHELKTPLTSMRTEIEVALRDKKLSAKDSQLLLKSNLEEVDKMKQLTNYLLALSRYENTNRNIQFQSVSIKEILERAIKMVSPKLTDKDLTFISEIQEFPVYGNASALEELFVILIDNAIKYSSKGDIIIRTYLSKNQKHIDIIDHGIGIKNTDIPYIFNRFYRADTSRSKHQVDGYGLGLSIAKSIVDLHKAHMLVKSEMGKGSTFSVIFQSSRLI
jgi:signal transduction histidine kinase